MKSHIVGTSIPENKPDADEKKRSMKVISELLAFGMLTNVMSDGGYIKDENGCWKELECEVVSKEA